RATAEEQKVLGGEPWKCTIFELYLYHLIRDERELKEIYADCMSGKLLCGACKKNAVEKLKNMLREHQKRFNEFARIVEKFVKKPGF
ncbi:MAG: tryptophan--tRNA ligase, partial [Desulfurococcaceae archaeon]